MPVGDILVAGIEQTLIFWVVRQIKLDAVGVDAPAYSLTEFLPTDVNFAGSIIL